MPGDVEIDELHRISVDDYHRLAEVGADEFLPHVELIDGLLVRKDMKSPEHENAIAWLLEWPMFGVDRKHFEVRVASALTLEHSEPEPDLMVIDRAAPRSRHPTRPRCLRSRCRSRRCGATSGARRRCMPRPG